MLIILQKAIASKLIAPLQTVTTVSETTTDISGADVTLKTNRTSKAVVDAPFVSKKAKK